VLAGRRVTVRPASTGRDAVGDAGAPT